MKIEIKDQWTGRIIYSGDHDSIKAAMASALKMKVNLCDANLRGANLCDANLRGANLRGANLCDANLRGADLCDANLRCADLCDANLRDADLRDANLRGANLRGADLCDANLRGANLCDANLRGADLRGADLCDANLRGADLRGANLRDADLRDANLRGANLRGADLCDAKNVALAIAATRILPAGSLIGWKKGLHDGTDAAVVIELEIPKDSRRSHAFGRKCRAEKAIVLSISGGCKKAHSLHDYSFTYEVGQIVHPREPFSENWTEECASGIHFFITREEAAAY